MTVNILRVLQDVERLLVGQPLSGDAVLASVREAVASLQAQKNQALRRRAENRQAARTLRMVEKANRHG